MEGKFAHLHVHTQYSLLDGFCNIKKLVKKIKSLGMDSVAITDHGVMFGEIEFYKECVAQGIKPILGCEIYMSERGMLQKEGRIDLENYHLILLAETNEGYKNLCKIVTYAYTDGFYRKPRADFDLLRKYSKGLIALTGCIAGKVPQKILRGQMDEARADLETLIDIFGRENLFVEIQDHNMDEEKRAFAEMIKLAKEYNLGVVATNDAHYIEQADADYHDVLLCVQTAAQVDDQKRMRFNGPYYYIKTPEEMEELFAYIPEALTNTGIIAERCNVQLEFHNYHLPRFDVPDNLTSAQYLRKMAFEGLPKRYDVITDELTERLDYELSVIDKMGFNEYILIVWDFIKYSKDHGISVGPGRGSAAGSVACYCLGITDIDPIKYSLIFERFLNIERVSMPDIDVDFCYENRHRVIEYVIEKYHETNVAQIVTFGTLGAKNAIKDVGRAVGMSYSETDRVAKEIPSRVGMTLDEAISESSALSDMIEADEKIAHLVEVSRALEGAPRHTSTHAAGVVITDIPIREYVPLYSIDGNIATQYSMTTIEELGLLKMDFLGLRTLTVIKDAVENVRRSQGLELDMTELSRTADDPGVFSMISRGDTLGVFQLESTGMRQFMQNLRPDTFEDIVAGIALYRPGPMQYINTYIANKREPAGIKYTHIALEPILNVTYGCMVYQEQVMQIVRDLAGYSMGQSDLVRRAMAKKKTEVMKAERKIFVYGDESKNVVGCVKNGVDEASANAIFDQMMDFASYAFNKSHAAAYALVTYQTGYLKCYYPAEFMAALMTSIIGDDKKVAQYTQNLKDMHIDMLGPDINESVSRFTVTGGKVRFGMLAVKGLGETAVEEILAAREAGGKFADFPDFVSRIEFKCLNKRGVEALIKGGAFDSVGHKRSDLLLVFSDYIDAVQRERKQNIEGQMSLFDLMGAGADSPKIDKMPAIPNSRELELTELLQYEKEAVGIYISGHPLSKYNDILEKYATHNYLSLNPGEEEEPLPDRLNVTVGGLITSSRTTITKKGDAMAFVQIEDMYGYYDVVVFPKLYAEVSGMLKADTPVLIVGNVSKKDEADCSVIASKIIDMRREDEIYSLKPASSKAKANAAKSSAKAAAKPEASKPQAHKAEPPKPEAPKPEPAPQKHSDAKPAETKAVDYPVLRERTLSEIPEGASVLLALDQNSAGYLGTLKQIMADNCGETRVILYDRQTKKKLVVPRSLYVGRDIEILASFREVIGAANVKLIE